MNEGWPLDVYEVVRKGTHAIPGYFMQPPNWLHHNYVFVNDENDLFAIYVAARVRLNKVFALLLEVIWVNTERQFAPNANPTLPISVGVEIDPGGHVFQIDVTYAGGLGENQ